MEEGGGGAAAACAGGRVPFLLLGTDWQLKLEMPKENRKCRVPVDYETTKKRASERVSRRTKQAPAVFGSSAFISCPFPCPPPLVQPQAAFL